MEDQEINYDTAVQYWSSVTTDEDGVLGGFGTQTVVPKVDVVGSRSFVNRLGQLSPETSFPNSSQGPKTILDVGAGVGRVSRDVLVHFAESVDLLEPAEPLIEKSKEILANVVTVNNFFEMGLQDFSFPAPYSYWAIWCQWCLGQVPDDVLVDFLVRAQQHLQPGGVIIVKENNASGGEDIYDQEDSSVTRTHEKFKALFARAGLRLLLTSLQKGFPKELFPVRLYALAP